MYLPLRFRPAPFIRVEVTSHYSTECKSWGCSKLQTLQITELLAPYLDRLNPLTQFHTEITSISYLQFDYESFSTWPEGVIISKLSVIMQYFLIISLEFWFVVLHGIY